MKRSIKYMACAAVIYGATLPGVAAAASVTDGASVYAGKCQSCHGKDGSGNPGIAKMMNVTMKPLGAQTDAEVKTAVTAGVGKMKPIAGIAAADVDNVIAYIHTLKK